MSIETYSPSDDVDRGPQAVIARHPSADAVRFGPFEYHRTDQRLERDGRDLELPPRALGVLDALLDRRGRIVSKQALIDEVWNGAFVADTSITEAISLLRQNLGDDAQDPRYIRTVHRRGYRFIADVEALPAPSPRAAEGPVDVAELVDGHTSSTDSAARPEASRRDLVEEPSKTRSRSRRRSLVAAVLLVLAGLTVGFVLATHRSSSIPSADSSDRSAAQATTSAPVQTRFEIQLPAGQREVGGRPFVAISPDGRHLVWAAVPDGATASRLYHRDFADLAITELPGTEGADYPFFSPDGRWIGFFAQGNLLKTPLDGHVQPIEISRWSKGRGASWGPDGKIVFSSMPGFGLFSVDENGGEREPLVVPDPSAGEVGILWPDHLPDGRILFTTWSNTIATAQVEVFDPADGSRTVVAHCLAATRFVAPGWLIYARSEAVTVAPFDLDTLEIGPPVQVFDELFADPFFGLVDLDVADDGTLVSVRSDRYPFDRDLVWIDGDGTRTPLGAPRKLYRNIEPSPDGSRLAVTITDGVDSDVWIVDAEGGTSRRLSFDGFDIEPIWSLDGAWVTFASNRAGSYDIYRKRADGDGAAELLLDLEHHVYPWAWMPGGKLLYAAGHPRQSFDIWVLDAETGERTAIAATAASESSVKPSPDSRYLAYDSDESGDWQIYVVDFPDLDSKWQVTVDGGWEPTWSRDGRELHFHTKEGFVTVPVRLDPVFEPGAPRVVTTNDDLAHVEPAADPRGTGRWVAIQLTPEEPPDALEVTVGWVQSLGAPDFGARKDQKSDG